MTPDSVCILEVVEVFSSLRTRQEVEPVDRDTSFLSLSATVTITTSFLECFSPATDCGEGLFGISSLLAESVVVFVSEEPVWVLRTREVEGGDGGKFLRRTNLSLLSGEDSAELRTYKHGCFNGRLSGMLDGVLWTVSGKSWNENSTADLFTEVCELAHVGGEGGRMSGTSADVDVTSVVCILSLLEGRWVSGT